MAKQHYHKTLTEFYIVQSGWIAYAEYREGQPYVEIIRQGKSINVESFVHHNIFMPSNSVIHTIKYGWGSENDWFASPELDQLIREVSEEELLKKYENTTTESK